MSIAWPDLAAALGLLLVIEGMMPFLSPGAVRLTMAKIGTMSDTTLRVAGAASMVGGLLLLWLARG